MADLKTLDYALNGQPFVLGKTNPALNLNTLDYALNAQPFTGDEIGGTIEPSSGDDFIPWICVF